MKTVLLVSFFGLTALMVLLWRGMQQRPGSFWDYVRNPGLLTDLDEYHAHVAAQAQAVANSPEKIAALVDQYVFTATSRSEAWTRLRVLAKLGDKTYPRALEILRDPALKDRLVVLKEGEYSLPEGPINRLCDMLDQEAPPPPAAAELLALYLQADSKEIRQSAALVIGSIAAPESLADLRRALSDEEEYVRSYALMGLDRALAGNRITETSRGEWFDLVASLWPADTSFEVCSSLPGLLLKLDRDRAIRFLLRDDLFTVTFEPVWRTLEAFDEESVEVPRERLLAIIAAADREPLEYPLQYVLQYAQPVLATHRQEADLRLFERLLDHVDENVVSGATAALYRYYRYEELIRDPDAAAEKLGWNRLTVVERHLLAIDELDGEVRNGGFAQYYFNSSGDHWPDAAAGLVAIGAPKRQQAMRETLNRFGKTPPSTDRSTRMDQLARIARKQEDPFSEQDSAWYGAEDENLDRLKLKYNLANLQGRARTDAETERKPE